MSNLFDKVRNLYKTTTLVNFVGGLIVLFAGFIELGLAVTSPGGFFTFGAILFILKLVMLGLAIYSLTVYKNDVRIKNTAVVVMIVGAALSIIPLLGFVGSIVSIVGGSIGLANIKKLN